jgi:hypothetical protein
VENSATVSLTRIPSCGVSKTSHRLWSNPPSTLRTAVPRCRNLFLSSSTASISSAWPEIALATSVNFSPAWFLAGAQLGSDPSKMAQVELRRLSPRETNAFSSLSLQDTSGTHTSCRAPAGSNPACCRRASGDRFRVRGCPRTSTGAPCRSVALIHQRPS